jgi:hypothetical protein
MTLGHGLNQKNHGVLTIARTTGGYSRAILKMRKGFNEISRQPLRYIYFGEFSIPALLMRTSLLLGDAGVLSETGLL